MKITSNYENAANIGAGKTMDSVSKDIQTQINRKQQEVQRLSGNEKMSMEEKMKKRQEIQQEIQDLNSRLRQHQLEERKEKQQKAAENMEKALGEQREQEETEKDTPKIGLPKGNVNIMISAESAMNQAAAHGKAAGNLKHQSNILASEIKQDAARGADTKVKEKQLSKMEKRAAKAETSRMKTLGKAEKEIRDFEKKSNEKKNSAKTVSGKAVSVKTGQNKKTGFFSSFETWM